ncbi:MAG: CapA family protein, partial [Lachnospiraceae bacterium]|nr:CapA family protein [Lachnospiraceae bacterium]
ANLFTEVGVDVVVGTHPHVVQTHEMRVRADGHKTLIYYSLGNFVSGQTKDNCRVRGIATFTIGQDFDGVTVTDYGYEEEEIVLN